jgi:hypothetical protein
LELGSLFMVTVELTGQKDGENARHNDGRRHFEDHEVTPNKPKSVHGVPTAG